MVLQNQFILDFWKYASEPLFEIGGTKVSVISVITAVIIFFLSSYLSKIAEKFVHRSLRDTHLDMGVRGSLATISRYVVLVVGIFVTLDTVGISLNSLAAIGAVLMVGIGFGLQNIAQNFISGLIILLERPIKVGDLVQVKDITGRIESIGSRATILRTRDDISVIVPNSQFIAEQVVNESFSGDQMRIHIDVGVAYGSDTKKVEQILIDVANQHPQVVKDPVPRVMFKNFGDSSLDFKLLIWTRDIWKADFTASDIRFAIDEQFRKNNITIPFPQRDLHLKTNETNLRS